MYPAVLSRLREEILTKVGPTRRPTYDDIRELKYLRAVINGALLQYIPYFACSAHRTRNNEIVSCCVRLCSLSRNLLNLDITSSPFNVRYDLIP